MANWANDVIITQCYEAVQREEMHKAGIGIKRDF